MILCSLLGNSLVNGQAFGFKKMNCLLEWLLAEISHRVTLFGTFIHAFSVLITFGWCQMTLSVVEVSQQLGICRDLVEIGRWMENKGCVSAWWEARLMMSSCHKSLLEKAISRSRDLVWIHELFVSLLLITELGLACFWSVLCPLPCLKYYLLKPAMLKASHKIKPFCSYKDKPRQPPNICILSTPKSRAAGNARNTD